MLIYDDIYHWEGWGGELKLASGRCRLKIFDLRKGDEENISVLKPFIVVVSDIPFENRAPNQMTVKSCASHIATKVVQEFNIKPHRMVWIEHYPVPPDSDNLKYPPVEHFDEVEFSWLDDMADPGGTRWKSPKPALEELVKTLLSASSE